jgi:hypothetical protein
LRKNFNLQYRKITKAGLLGPVIGLGVGYGPCGCTPDLADPNCYNRYSYVRDWIGGKPETIRECPRRFDDRELWQDVKVALFEVKSWENVQGFYGVPVVHLSPIVYNMLRLSFDARDRYHGQKAEKEG